MKVYIAVDMEGATGICCRDQISGSGPLYAEGRRLLTLDVNAAVQGALDGGASEVLVADVHSNSFNLIHDLIHPKAQVFYGRAPRAPRFPFLDESVGAFFLVGYHAMAGTRSAVMEHTMSSHDWFRLLLNGKESGEAAIDAAIAGERGVPTVLLTGDDAVCAEARAFFPGIETVSVKKGTGRHGALCLSLAATEKLIREGARRAVEKAKTVKPYVLQTPVQVGLVYKHTENADGLYASESEGWKRIDGYSVERSFPRISDWYGGQWKA